MKLFVTLVLSYVVSEEKGEVILEAAEASSSLLNIWYVMREAGRSLAALACPLPAWHKALVLNPTKHGYIPAQRLYTSWAVAIGVASGCDPLQAILSPVIPGCRHSIKAVYRRQLGLCEGPNSGAAAVSAGAAVPRAAW